MSLLSQFIHTSLNPLFLLPHLTITQIRIQKNILKVKKNTWWNTFMSEALASSLFQGSMTHCTDTAGTSCHTEQSTFSLIY